MSHFPDTIHLTVRPTGSQANVQYDVHTGKAEDTLTTTDRKQVATYKLVEVREGKLEPVFSVKVG